MSLNELKRNTSEVFKDLKLAWTDAIEAEKDRCKKEERKFKLDEVYRDVMRREADLAHKLDQNFLECEERLAKFQGGKKKFFN